METDKIEGAQSVEAETQDERAPEEAKKEKEKAAHPRAHAHANKKSKNNVRKLRMERMMSKAELARRAGLSTLTVDRVERGMSCRMDTKRKILEALGLKPQDRVMVFGDSEDD
jgi:DNA-binding XRE family transcriptional regulator